MTTKEKVIRQINIFLQKRKIKRIETELCDISETMQFESHIPKQDIKNLNKRYDALRLSRDIEKGILESYY